MTTTEPAREQAQEGPDAHSGSQGGKWHCRCHPAVVWSWHPTSMGGGHRVVRGVTTRGAFWTDEDGDLVEYHNLAEFRYHHHVVEEPPTPAPYCGHDLEAFERFAEVTAERDRLKDMLDTAQTAYLAQANELTMARSERDKLAATIAAYLGTDERAVHDAANLAHARAQRDRLADTVRRVRALCEREAAKPGHPNSHKLHVVEILAALDASPSDTESGARGQDEGVDIEVEVIDIVDAPGEKHPYRATCSLHPDWYAEGDKGGVYAGIELHLDGRPADVR